MGNREGPSRISAKDVLWRLINIVVAGLWIVTAAFHFVDGTFQSAMPGIAILVIGVASIVFEFWRPEVILENCYFLWNFMGRGLFFLLMGCLVMAYRVINYVSAGFSWFFGFLYIVLWFTSFALFPVANEPPPVV
ncbi:hypothetical protein LPJ78_003450 [Coemansia sp. RSA 989]|nr:Golgi apparatus membrane protein TVP15 [Coemansia mojavensis]KAJ1740652.1 hypothetical protein LPJ68_003582 [Coemansia sp. RSA 1086]KAJ1750104.1 hypothetical protein LPJ79_003203 [Coemansia sp. RSA 1821]KAJ1864358.1 hypothetical protein LPJ78_003450 [Coemansia sp. RSA 989]KAJ1874328.1 hypothetical protein LPJ55_001575 [Coemansia sp. RSA 990]KAJ2649481.1 hypothetical protein IWW40_003153 [Coemansia sp. RSA 1250]KAJ2670754.1 hypothetical protein IWW42_003787 [Coemansia sp. RSA 1085]